MSYARFALLKLTLSRALLIATLPTACAVGVTQEDTGDTSDPVNTGGKSAGGTLGASGSISVVPKAGTTGSAGSAVGNAFGGTTSTAGNAGSSSGGQSAAGSGSGGKAGSSSGGTSGAGGSSAGGSSSAGTGGGAGVCACPTKKPWADNTSINFATGDCFDVTGAVYAYTGAKAQTWANKDCNPAMQLAWCSDMGADYKFTLCK